MVTIEGILEALIFIGGGVVFSSFTLFLILAAFLFVWRTLVGMVHRSDIALVKSQRMQPMPMHESTHTMSSSPSRDV